MTQSVAARLRDTATPTRSNSSIPSPVATHAHPATLSGPAPVDPSLVSTVLGTLASGVRAFTEELNRLYDRERVHLETIRAMREQLSLAASVQRNLLPDRIPEIGGLDVTVFYQPADVISGDCYDVVRLDDRRVAFTIADATGHGVPAALLAAFVKRAFRAAQSPDGRGRPPDPDVVLRRVNADLCEAELTDCQFVAALYAVYDEKSRRIRWARGGTPYPLLRHADGALRTITSEGPLVGVCEKPSFEVAELELRPGDSMILHTDGTEQLGGVRALTSWGTSFLADRMAALRGDEPVPDDVTVLSLRACAQPRSCEPVAAPSPPCVSQRRAPATGSAPRARSIRPPFP